MKIRTTKKRLKKFRQENPDLYEMLERAKTSLALQCAVEGHDFRPKSDGYGDRCACCGIPNPALNADGANSRAAG